MPIMDKIKNDDLSTKTIDELFEEIATGPIVEFADAGQKPTEQFHCNLKKEPWEYHEKLIKPTTNFNPQNLKHNLTQVNGCIENANNGREL